MTCTSDGVVLCHRLLHSMQLTCCQLSGRWLLFWVFAGTHQPATPAGDTGCRDLSEELHSNSNDPQVSLSPLRIPFHNVQKHPGAHASSWRGEEVHGFSGSTKLGTITAKP